jgi:hypothetical protein
MTDEELRDLQERCQLISEMAASPGWTLLRDRAAHTIGTSQQRILNGRLDHNEYIREAGWQAGAFFILDLPGQIVTELENELAFRREIEDAQEIEDEAA